MSVHHFGCGWGQVSDAERERVSAIAEQHKAEFVRVHRPGEGPRFWFSCQNLGDLVNDRRAAKVLAEVGGVRVTPPPRSEKAGRR